MATDMLLPFMTRKERVTLALDELLLRIDPTHKSIAALLERIIRAGIEEIPEEK